MTDDELNREQAIIESSTARQTQATKAASGDDEALDFSGFEASPIGTSDREVVLSARGIHKWLGGTEVLKGVDLDVRSHEVVSIVGPSGAGKSTFLRCMNLLERPDQGEVTIEGMSLTTARRGELRRLRARLGMVFQSFNLFPHLTAEDNVALAPVRVLGLSRSEARERAHDLLRRVGLGLKAGSYPRELSGGQQQRVAIARALAMQPRVMLFDEPTSALDAETVHEVVAVMRQLSEAGMTMVVVSHEVGFVKEASSRLLFIDEGRVLAEAAPRDFFSNPPNERATSFVSKIL